MARLSVLVGRPLPLGLNPWGCGPRILDFSSSSAEVRSSAYWDTSFAPTREAGNATTLKVLVHGVSLL